MKKLFKSLISILYCIDNQDITPMGYGDEPVGDINISWIDESGSTIRKNGVIHKSTFGSKKGRLEV